MNPSITAIIIAKNEEDKIVNCLDCLKWCDDIIVIDNYSTDSTHDLVKKLSYRIYQCKSDSFSQLRNYAIDKVKTDWMLYIDCDERVTPKLALEIKNKIKNKTFSAYSINRKNIHYAVEMTSGGWQTDDIIRLFYKKDFKQWQGDVHEHAIYKGKTDKLDNPLIHLTHCSIRQGLIKSADWTYTEAQLINKHTNKHIKPRHIIYLAFKHFIKRVIKLKAYKDGEAGMIEAIVQAINKALVYSQVWELQQDPSIASKYLEVENNIQQLWENNEIV